MDDASNRFDNAEQTTVVLEDVHLTTTIGAVKVKTGTWNGSDTILAKDSDRTSGNWILSTDMQGVSIALEGDTQASATSTTFSGDIAGVAAKYKMKSTSDELYLAADVAGVAVTYAGISADAANSDAAAFTLSKEFNGVTVSTLMLMLILHTQYLVILLHSVTLLHLWVKATMLLQSS